MSTTTRIGIEKIATGTVIEVPGFGPAEVFDLKFDGEGYGVRYCTNDRAGWDSLDITTINAGELVECLDGRTFLRAEKDIPREEIETKTAALNEAIFAMTDVMDARRGCVSRNVDAEVEGAIAAAVGAPALQAAE